MKDIKKHGSRVDRPILAAALGRKQTKTLTYMKTRPALLHRIAITLLSLVAAGHAASITVTSTADGGPGSLRQAISDATAGATIYFSLPANSTITLTSGTLLINKDLTLAGTGPPAAHDRAQRVRW